MLGIYDPHIPLLSRLFFTFTKLHVTCITGKQQQRQYNVTKFLTLNELTREIIVKILTLI